MAKIKSLNSLDILFSEYIRKRAIASVQGCERCLTPKFDIQKENGDILEDWKQLQCSHFIGRSKRSVRWDEENCIGICGACHLYLTAHPIEHVEFFKARLGDRFDMLNSRARIPAKYMDKNALMIYYKAKIKELENE